MEKDLPFKCYSREWELLEEGRVKKTYWPLTHVEQYVPALFAIPYILLLVVAAYMLV